MSLELQNYYSTNYSNCNLSYHWLATWQGLAYPSHAIQVIASPIQIFTFYIIWTKTPSTMKSMKSPLLVNHFWSTWFDFMVCTLSTPYVFLPTTGLFGVGILSSLGFSFIPQLVTGFVSCLCLCSSYLYLFESRSSALPQNRFRMTRKVSRILYHSLVLFINLPLLLSMFFFTTTAESEKLKALKTDPCPTKEFFEFPVIFFISDPEIRHFFLIILLPVMGVHSFGNLGFHVSCTVYYLFVATPKTTISSGTRRAQRNFFIGISFQAAIPVLIFLVPAAALLVLVFTENYKQEFMNLAVITFGMNGLAESLAILSIHHPFRIAVKRMLRCGKYRASPIQIFTFYIIWTKTPITMNNMKLPLLVNHFWSTWFDFMICTLSTPYVFLPTTGIFSVGILSSLGFSFIPQLVTGTFSAMCLGSSYIYLFESRSSALSQNRFRMTRKSSRIFYHSLVLSINLTLLLLTFFFTTTAESEKLEALKTYPCPTNEFFKFPVTFFVSDPEVRQFFLKFLMPGFGVYSFGNLGFHVACTVYYLFLANPTTTLSTGTRRAQRAFFIGISFQAAIPVLIFLVPTTGLVVSVYTDNYRQEFMNSTVIIFALNGLAESLAILSIHHPFRQAVKKMLGFGRHKEFKIRTIPVHELLARANSS
ncbi:unnamed protein product [Caenorhabditis nigoni]